MRIRKTRTKAVLRAPHTRVKWYCYRDDCVLKHVGK